jgi:hypothetical protein
VTSEGLTLQELQCVHLVSYLATEAQGTLEQWQRRFPVAVGNPSPAPFRILPDGENKVSFSFQLTIDEQPVKGEVSASILHDTLAVLCQYQFLGTPTAYQAAEWCRRLLVTHAAPPGELGQTLVVMAQADSASRPRMAEAVLAALTGSKAGPVRGCPLSPGVELFSGTDPTWLVLLSEPGQETEKVAGGFLYGPLRMVETSFHKIVAHQAEYEKIRGEGGLLASRSQNLQSALNCLSQQVEQKSPDYSLHALKATLEENTTQAAQACRELTEAVSRARRMQVSIEANRANLIAYLGLLGQDAGAPALTSRHRRADLALEQVRTDLGYLQPLLEFARWLGNLHQSRLLTSLNVTNVQEAEHHHKVTLLLEILIIWLTLMQFWGLAVTVYYTDNKDFSIFRKLETAKTQEGVAQNTEPGGAVENKPEPPRSPDGLSGFVGRTGEIFLVMFVGAILTLGIILVVLGILWCLFHPRLCWSYLRLPKSGQRST